MRSRSWGDRGATERVGCNSSRAAVVNGRKHGWNAAHPDLFAAGVTAGIEEIALPVDY